MSTSGLNRFFNGIIASSGLLPFQWVVPTNGDLFRMDMTSGNLISEKNHTMVAQSAGIEYQILHPVTAGLKGVRLDGNQEHFQKSSSVQDWNPENFSFVIMIEYEWEAVASSASAVLDFGTYLTTGTNEGFHVFFSTTLMNISLTDEIHAKHRSENTTDVPATRGDGLTHILRIVVDKTATKATFELDGNPITSVKRSGDSDLNLIGNIDRTGNSRIFTIGNRGAPDDRNFGGKIYRVAFAKNTITYDGVNQ